MPPPSKFSKEQETWLSAALKEWQAELKSGVDNEELKKWKSDKMTDFIASFRDEITESGEAAGNLRKRLDAKFRTAKFKLKGTEVAPLPSTPWSVFPKPQQSTARELFRDAHYEEINAETTRRREDAGEDSNLHAARFQQVLKEHWDRLNEDEKAHWETQCKERAREQELSGKSQVYRNQKDFVPIISRCLGTLIGNASHQLGDAVFHLMYAFRDEGGNVVHQSVSVISKECTERYSAMPNYERDIAESWASYCKQVLKREVDDTSSGEHIKLDVDGCPLLPVYDVESTPAVEIRAILKAFLEAMWKFTQGGSSTSDQGETSLPWTEIFNLPTKFVRDRILVTTTTLQDPATAPLPTLITLASHLRHILDGATGDDRIVFRAKEAIEGWQPQGIVQPESVLDDPPTNPSIGDQDGPASGDLDTGGAQDLPPPTDEGAGVGTDDNDSAVDAANGEDEGQLGGSDVPQKGRRKPGRARKGSSASKIATKKSKHPLTDTGDNVEDGPSSTPISPKRMRKRKQPPADPEEAGEAPLSNVQAPSKRRKRGLPEQEDMSTNSAAKPKINVKKITLLVKPKKGARIGKTVE
ncbi:hypothetical protein JAAARDRAFT_200990 [Jaapia argillacea MUCL 33604]|uniref:Uncharacterized protein n=1 Tax=Jaapia argillacea MUCL 33604 TaxID=933084 RepID=A0A067PE30_9AGAM|nr:hypothetical protein JAAARDRAFT_200990 [Jaapia argillacea MUCL 33604]